MTVKNTIIDLPQEDIMDDSNIKPNTDTIDADTMAALKAKLSAKKEQEKAKPAKVERQRAINFGVIGSGQSGNRLAETWYKLGYDSVVINTAQMDLEHIEIPASNKLLLNYSIGGAAKSLEIGAAAAEANRVEIRELVERQLADAQMFIYCTSLGGGSGAGSTETIISILAELNKPILVIGVLPMNSDDFQTKNNSLQILNKVLKLVQSKTICNLVVVDNAKIEAIYHDVNQMDFFSVANSIIVNPLDIFNTYSAKPSNVKSLDPLEFIKLLTDGGGLSVYGELTVENYQEETAIAEAIIGNLSSNLLANGFDIKQSQYVGVMICAPKKVWSNISASSVNYAMAIINEECGTPLGTFKGIYEIEENGTDCVKVYSFFSGLGLPDARINQLTEETKQYTETVKNKDIKRNLSLNMDDGKSQAISDAQKVKDKIASKASVFGKFLTNNLTDRRSK